MRCSSMKERVKHARHPSGLRRRTERQLGAGRRTHGEEDEQNEGGGDCVWNTYGDSNEERRLCKTVIAIAIAIVLAIWGGEEGIAKKSRDRCQDSLWLCCAMWLSDFECKAARIDVVAAEAVVAE